MKALIRKSGFSARRNFITHSLSLIILAILILAGGGRPALSAEQATAKAQARIANGIESFDYPSVVTLIRPALKNFSNCSGTLIGCSTVLTAAHCVCK
ncbi:MAG: trypsin-like serine protease, partial [Desulfuromonadales bacterium]|nr:trypsin-like serine protease [Desulfuromonadales bacterium]